MLWFVPSVRRRWWRAARGTSGRLHGHVGEATQPVRAVREHDVLEAGEPQRPGGAVLELPLLVALERGDAAKVLASERTGIPVDHMLMSATHCHSGVTVTGVFQSDPHPGNLLARLEGTQPELCILDFGQVKFLPKNILSQLELRILNELGQMLP